MTATRGAPAEPPRILIAVSGCEWDDAALIPAHRLLEELVGFLPEGWIGLSVDVSVERVHLSAVGEELAEEEDHAPDVIEVVMGRDRCREPAETMIPHEAFGHVGVAAVEEHRRSVGLRSDHDGAVAVAHVEHVDSDARLVSHRRSP